MKDNYFYSFEAGDKTGQGRFKYFSWGIIQLDLREQTLYDEMISIFTKNYPYTENDVELKMIAFNKV